MYPGLSPRVHLGLDATARPTTQTITFTRRLITRDSRLQGGRAAGESKQRFARHSRPLTSAGNLKQLPAASRSALSSACVHYSAALPTAGLDRTRPFITGAVNISWSILTDESKA